VLGHSFHFAYTSNVSPMVWGFLFLSTECGTWNEARSAFVEVVIAVFIKFICFRIYCVFVQIILVVCSQEMLVLLLNACLDFFAFKLSFVRTSPHTTHCARSAFTNWSQNRTSGDLSDIFSPFVLYSRRTMAFFRRTVCTDMTDTLTTF
jgi:hypothetical protein